jgi:hypothetical protein
MNRALPFLLAFLVATEALSGPGPKLTQVASARAYAYNTGFELGSPGWCDSLFVGKGEVCGNASQPVALTSWQLRRLKELLLDSRNAASTIDKCWKPRHALELLDAAGKRVGQVELSLECDQIRSPWTTSHALSRQGAGAWRALMRDLGLRAHLTKPVPGQDTAK